MIDQVENTPLGACTWLGVRDTLTGEVRSQLARIRLACPRTIKHARFFFFKEHVQKKLQTSRLGPPGSHRTCLLRVAVLR